MKNILTHKTRIYVGVVAVLILSLAIIATTNIYSDLDWYIYINYRPTVVIFIFVFIIGLINGYMFSVCTSAVMKKPALIYSMMNTLIVQLCIFSVLYFFLDGIFDNDNVLIPYNLQGKSIVLNLSIIFGAFLIRSIKAKKVSLNIKTLLSLALSFVLIFQMNYLELAFYGIFFGIIYLIGKIDYKKINEILSGKKSIILIVLVVLMLTAVLYVLFSIKTLALGFSYILTLSLLCWLVYNNGIKLRRDLL